MTDDIEFAEQALISANADLLEECPPGCGIMTLRVDWMQRYSDAKSKLETHYGRKIEAQKIDLGIKDEIFHSMLREIAELRDLDEVENISHLDLLGLLEMDYRLQMLAVCYGTPLGSKRPSNIVDTAQCGNTAHECSR
jgi:hypothetical protein